MTGHRPGNLQGADEGQLQAAVSRALQSIARAATQAHAAAGRVYTPEPPLLRLVSSLTEGADRLVAQEARALGYELICPLPFGRDEYEQDSRGPSSVAEYRGLLSQAGAVFALDGSRHTPEQQTQAYTAATRVMLGQSDVLIAVWDGEASRGAGGTAEAVNDAVSLGLPVLWIHSHAPHHARLLAIDRAGRREEHELGALTEHIHNLLQPPRAESGREQAGVSEPLSAFLAERQPRWAPIGWAWSSFTSLSADLRVHLPRVLVRPYVATAERAWRRGHERRPALPRAMSDQIERALLIPYAWADGLAVYYAEAYRSSFVLYYFLGVLATVLALLIGAAGLADATGPVTRLLRAGAFLSVLLILLLWLTASRRRWQQRWIDYRLLAEALRQHRFLILLGRSLSFSRLPRRHGHQGHTAWVAWYFRAVARRAGLLDAELKPPVVDAARHLLQGELLEEEARYHQSTAQRLQRMETRLRRLGSGLFVVALLALGILVLREVAWLDFIAALLPVTGGALAAIRSQAELGRVTTRSQAMAEQLQTLAIEVRALNAATSEQLARPAEAAAQAMLGDVLDWQVVFLEKPLDLG